MEVKWDNLIKARKRFNKVNFTRFKAFRALEVNLNQFNILVGPNNAGKSTILTAFRILAAAIRRAESKKAEIVDGPLGKVYGHKVELANISVAYENIYFNYDETIPAQIVFHISGGNTLTLYFPEQGICNLIPDAQGRPCVNPKSFQSEFDCSIGFVPILGPVEHNELRYEKEAARLALFNYGAARNFRNIWYHFPDKFAEFRKAINETWPGMDIEPPSVDTSHAKPRLHMFCPEDRIPREIFWAGFGFQVWCQMLTHIIQSSHVSLFLIDEPDIYLHSDLQRQLLAILRTLGPDILIATHSTEIITEAEADDILLIAKGKTRSKRIKNPSQLEEIFRLLGSNVNPILTQVAKTRRVVFVEGKDFQILSRFAAKLGLHKVSTRNSFAVVPVDGFNPERTRSIKAGMEFTLGSSIATAVVLDRDYRSDKERKHILHQCLEYAETVVIHHCKEIENYLLVPAAIDRAATSRIADRNARTGEKATYSHSAAHILQEFTDKQEHYVTSQYLALRRRFEKLIRTGEYEEKIDADELKLFSEKWSKPDGRIEIIPGKSAISHVNGILQDAYQISLTTTALVDAIHVTEIHPDLRSLLESLDGFCTVEPH